ncbi:MAG: SigE family RNA polymerase sigma factor [Acidimicrobiales bacterium]
MDPEKNFPVDVTRDGDPGVLLAMNGAAITTNAGVEGLSTYLPVSGSFDDALAELYRAHAKALVEMLWVFVGERAEAEDLCQEAFIRLHRVWNRIDRTADVGAYLRTIAFNLARSGFRRHQIARRLHPLPDAAGAPAADEGVELRTDQRELLGALRRLPARQRECVVLRYWQEQSDTEIAVTLGISPNSVKTHLRRAMDSLERYVERQ